MCADDDDDADVDDGDGAEARESNDVVCKSRDLQARKSRDEKELEKKPLQQTKA